MTAEQDYQACLKAEEQYKHVGEKYEKAETGGTLTPELKVSLEKEDENLFEEAKKIYAHFFEIHINTAFAQKIFSETRWVRRLNPEQLESVINKVNDPAFIATEVYKKAVQRVSNLRASVKGNIYKDIKSVDPEGKPVALSEYVGKGNFVLLDFWASWCPDCVKDMPDLVKLHEKYKGKNFVIVSYSLDKEKEAWVTGVSKLGMVWPQMSDLGSWESVPVETYAVQSIPCTILIDPKGKLVERGVPLSSLAEELEGLLLSQ